jgi:menaquinone-specific isochorismate synthase
MTTTELRAGHRLRAVTREVPPPPDVLDALGADGVAWLHEGAAFATAGVAARVAPDDAVAFLASIEHDGDPRLPGPGPLAVGALPFDPDAAGELVVPSSVVGATADGRAWRTDIGPPRDGAAATRTEPSSFAVSAQTSRAEWASAVSRALEAIGRGELVKVVLARIVTVDAELPYDLRAVLARLRAQQPGCFVYCANGLVGASPELLVARHGTTVVARPMAGTAVLGDESADALRTSRKDGREHRVVVDAIVDALRPQCTRLDVADRPEVDTFAEVAHLATPLLGTLREPAPDALALARLLHPTPAVAGTPTDAALEAIAELEHAVRGSYAGPVGWVDARGDGEWAVALRGAAIAGRRAVLHSGAGIVAGSDADAEWVETQAKLEPMLRALVRP